MKAHLYPGLVFLFLFTGCGTFAVSMEQVTPSVAPMLEASAATDTAPVPPGSGGLVVSFIQDGNILVWDETSRETKTIFASGDVERLAISDDGQLIAFLRRTLFEGPEIWDQYALWVVEPDGQNPRELVSAETVRQRMNVTVPDSSGITGLVWIPNTHRIIYHTNRYYLPGQGSNESPDVYVVDADTGSDIPLAQGVVPNEGVFHSVKFVPSPDGQQVALITGTHLDFINVDGSNWRKSALTYPVAGCSDVGCILPKGVWTQDSTAFLITGSFEENPIVGMDFTIWRVPVDGSGPEALASVMQSHPDSVAFSPSGQQFAFTQWSDPQLGPVGSFMAPLAGNVGPLAIPSKVSGGDLHWSPAGSPFTGNLMQLCPGATNTSEVCDSPTGYEGQVQAIEWIDSARILFLTYEPAVLFYGNLGETAIPIATWPAADSGGDFDAVVISPP